MHGILYADENGAAVSPLYTWQDERGNLEYKDGATYAEYLNSKATVTGTPLYSPTISSESVTRGRQS